jgi:hypothetical protein
MKRILETDRIQIVAQRDDHWTAEVRLRPGESVETAIFHYLHQVKAQLARQYNVSVDQLLYKRLLERTRTPQGLVVELEIVRQETRKGNPVFRLEPMTGPDGTLFPDMILKVDLFPYDDYDKPLTRELLEYCLSLKGIQLDLLDWPALNKAIETVKATEKEILDLTGGHGVFPDFGRDAVLEYALPVEEKSQAFSALIGTRRVKKGSILLRYTPPTTGVKVGMNLLGREIAPRKGWDVELFAEEGVKFSPDGSLLTAESEGLARFERLEQTVRRQGKIERVPARIVARVEPLHTIQGNCTLQLDWDGHLEVDGTVCSGSKLNVTGAIIVHGDVEEGCEIFSKYDIHIDGKISGSVVESDGHLAAGATEAGAEVKAAKKVFVPGVVEESSIRAQDVHVGEVRRSKVHASHEFVADKVDESVETESEIVVNMREFLGLRQTESAATLQEMAETMKRLIQLFGPKAIQSVSSTNASQILHQFLRERKEKGLPAYSPREIINLRSALELVPEFRRLLTDLGQELRDLTEQIAAQQDQELVLVRESIPSFDSSKSNS